MATLEEFIQEKYVELYDEIENESNKVLDLINSSETSKFFYKPTVGSLNYVIDNEGHALYLIDKNGLPNEIKTVLVGGDAGEKEFSDYQKLNDVYGVTSNLKVYYCSNGIDTLVGLAKEELDNDNPNREVFNGNDSEMYGSLSEYDKDNDGILTADEVKKITQLVITKDSGINSLKELYKLNNLRKLTIDGVSLNNLDGIENVGGLNYVYIKNNANILDYSKISTLKESLQYLYLYNMPDSQFENLCKGMQNTDFEKLEYLAVVGNTNYISKVFGGNGKMGYVSDSSTYKITSLDPLNYLSNLTKERIKYLSLQCNAISSVTQLSEFKGVYLLRLEGNQLTSLDGLQNMNELNYLYACSNNLGSSESPDGKSDNDSLIALTGKTNLKGLHISSNPNLIWVDYISSCTSLENLYLGECSKIDGDSLKILSNLWYCISGERKTIDSDKEKFFESENIINWANLDDSRYQNEIKAQISAMTSDRKNKVYKLDLSNSSLENDILVDIIKNFPNVICLNVDGCSKLTSTEFFDVTKKIEEFGFMDTGIYEVHELERLNNATSVTAYRCNNPLIDITKLQDLISRTEYYTGAYKFKGSEANGLYCKKLIEDISKCDKITRLRALNWESYVKDEVTIDLSGCKNLSSIDIQVGDNFTFRFSGGTYSTISWYCNSGHLEFIGDMEIDQLRLPRLFNKKSNYLDIFGDDKDKSFHVRELYLWTDSSNTNVDVDMVSVLSSINISEINAVESVELNQKNWNYNNWGGTLENLTSLTVNSGYAPNLDFLSKNSQLKKLIMKNCSIGDISGISELSTLNKIDFTNNGITDLFPLKDLNNLTSLNLSSNPFDNYSFKKGEESYTNLGIIADLNRSGNLKKLYLKNCNGLSNEDLNIVKNLHWTASSF